MRHAVRRAYRVHSIRRREPGFIEVPAASIHQESAASGDNMMGNNYYCAGDQCRRTTRRLCVRMRKRTYFYCVNCGRRLELRDDLEIRARKAS